MHSVTIKKNLNNDPTNITLIKDDYSHNDSYPLLSLYGNFSE